MNKFKKVTLIVIVMIAAFCIVGVANAQLYIPDNTVKDGIEYPYVPKFTKTPLDFGYPVSPLPTQEPPDDDAPILPVPTKPPAELPPIFKPFKFILDLFNDK